ncbi:MAG: hypothetical protein ABI039_13995 [Vicinamibacterales bacterium]
MTFDLVRARDNAAQDMLDIEKMFGPTATVTMLVRVPDHRDRETFYCHDDLSEVMKAIGHHVVPRTLDEWHEDIGDVVWWSLDDAGQWRGEAAYVGTPLDLGRGYKITIGDAEFVAHLGGWPGYHTHWTPHPAFPRVPA